MKNILVPVDLSSFSNEVINHAIALAQDLNGKLTLLHVVSLDIGFIIGDMGYHYLPELEETTLHEDAKALKQLELKVREMGVEVASLVKQGIPVDTILEEAETMQADLIAIGSKGHGTLYEAFVGSVCRDVIKNAEIPIYVIPHQKKRK
ncbi:universal stress protein [Flavobacteriaceae bacterium Ap0902]|nr:universal stress protein [Flavobacteriaceae bacterium Ap0902]